MPPEKADPALLGDMLEAAIDVRMFVRGKAYDDYVTDKLLRSGVERRIEVIGEAARRVSSTCKQAHPEIPWRAIIAQRHVLAHEYGEIIHERIWKLANVHVPELIRLLEPLVPEPPADPGD